MTNLSFEKAPEEPKVPLAAALLPSGKPTIFPLDVLLAHEVDGLRGESEGLRADALASHTGEHIKKIKVCVQRFEPQPSYVPKPRRILPQVARIVYVPLSAS
jgi:hypothetical protein